MGFDQFKDLAGRHISFQDYGAAAGRVASIAVDQADTSGNTVYVGGASGGLWRSTNAATANPANVQWTPLIDDQATLAVGAIALKPGNSSTILVGTGEPNFAGGNYYDYWARKMPQNLDSYISGDKWDLKSYFLPGLPEIYNIHGHQYGLPQLTCYAWTKYAQVRSSRGSGEGPSFETRKRPSSCSTSEPGCGGSPSCSRSS